MAAKRSTETILTYKKYTTDDENMSDWSIHWSTDNIPGMDMGTGAGSSRRRKSSRRRLRIAALSFGCLMTMHVRVSAAAVSCGYFIFILILIPVTAILANPLRHFEVYLGQWSLSGPGRAFRIIPMFDGIGIAICLHAILRAIVCVVLAGLAMVLVSSTASDEKLPFSYCRNFDLDSYEAIEAYVTIEALEAVGKKRRIRPLAQRNNESYTSSKGMGEKNYDFKHLESLTTTNNVTRRENLVCNESYRNNFPPIYKTTAYNYFYVELIHYRTDNSLRKINKKLLISIMVIWLTLWVFIIKEKISHGRLIWNNTAPWFLCIPCLWAGLLLFTGGKKFFSRSKPLRNVIRIGGHKEILDFTTNAFVTAMYIHAAGLGSALIFGKGLNHYASGHIDPLLAGETVWYSAVVLLMAALCSGGASLCALTDYMQMLGVNRIQESTLWIMPMLAKCTLSGGYGHLTSTLLFLGLAFSYTIVAYVCLKTALHTIFEYNVKLVFVEQVVVALMMFICMGISVIFATNASLGILESLDLFLAGIASPIICALETFGLLYVYRSRDFISDMNVATEDSTCSSRFGIQWQALPFIQIIVFLLEAITIAGCELPAIFIFVGMGCTILIILALPLRACHNTYHFLRPPKPNK